MVTFNQQWWVSSQWNQQNADHSYKIQFDTICLRLWCSPSCSWRVIGLILWQTLNLKNFEVWSIAKSHWPSPEKYQLTTGCPGFVFFLRGWHEKNPAGGWFKICSAASLSFPAASDKRRRTSLSCRGGAVCCRELGTSHVLTPPRPKSQCIKAKLSLSRIFMDFCILYSSLCLPGGKLDKENAEGMPWERMTRCDFQTTISKGDCKLHHVDHVYTWKQ